MLNQKTIVEIFAQGVYQRIPLNQLIKSDFFTDAELIRALEKYLNFPEHRLDNFRVIKESPQRFLIGIPLGTPFLPC